MMQQEVWKTKLLDPPMLTTLLTIDIIRNMDWKRINNFVYPRYGALVLKMLTACSQAFSFGCVVV